MDEKRYGLIANVSSIVGEYGNIGQINNSVSNAAIIRLTKSCANEFEKKVRI